MKNICFLLNTSVRGILVDLFFLEFLYSIFASLYPWRHLASIFWMPESSYSNVIASILMAFLIAFS